MYLIEASRSAWDDMVGYLQTPTALGAPDPIIEGNARICRPEFVVGVSLYSHLLRICEFSRGLAFSLGLLARASAPSDIFWCFAFAYRA
mmetsp:Transcript_11120/g.27674  ORF Transcript_11120/g.27674 Transcript_11120/m.27674 type:complete len:89 (-) Transcript_11120:123-389(-)